ncbi:hypothetical protein ACOMHN_044690 [Nucella lapillus]
MTMDMGYDVNLGTSRACVLACSSSSNHRVLLVLALVMAALGGCVFNSLGLGTCGIGGTGEFFARKPPPPHARPIHKTASADAAMMARDELGNIACQTKGKKSLAANRSGEPLTTASADTNPMLHATIQHHRETTSDVTEEAPISPGYTAANCSGEPPTTARVDNMHPVLHAMTQHDRATTSDVREENQVT